MKDILLTKKSDAKGENLPKIISQYLKVKEENEDCVILFRLGEFWETYFEDALLLSKECEIALTKRKLKAGSVLMAGVPNSFLDDYVKKLVKNNHRVALCEQGEEKEDGILKRKIKRIYSAGSFFEDNLFSEEKNNYLCAIYEEGGVYALGWCDVSSGDFYVTEGNDDEILRELEKIDPTELLAPVKPREFKPFSVIKDAEADIEIDLTNFNVTLVAKRYYSTKLVKADGNFTGKKGKRNSDEGNATECVLNLGYKCANAIMSYVLETQMDFAPKFNNIREYQIKNYLVMNSATIENLELLKNMTDKKCYGSLLWAIDKTRTAMGKRLLAEWIKRPLRDREAILRRQNAIFELSRKKEYTLKLRNILENCYDIKRLWGKLTNKTVTAKDLLSIKKTLENVTELENIIRNFENPLLNFATDDFEVLKDFAEILEKTIEETAQNTIKAGGIIKEGADADLDYFKNEINKTENELSAYEKEQRKLTGIKSLKIGYNKVFGYYIEVGNSYLKNIKDNYTAKQTLSSATRFYTKEIIEFENKINTLKVKIYELEDDLFSKIKNYSFDLSEKILVLADNLAQADVLQSIYFVSEENNYAKPEISDDGIIEIKNGFHPVVTKICKNFTRNNFSSEKLFTVMTGPNMAGKSTYLKQIAIIAIMAQMGSFVSAEKVKTGIIDKIFTQMGSREELIMGNSTFMVEMLNVKNILDNATEKSLILLDELGKGTSSSDGLALARAISEYIIKKIKAPTIFATHFHKLSSLEKYFSKQVQNLMIGDAFDKETGQFERHVKKGVLNESYGINVAKSAGLPPDIIECAKNYVEK